MDPLEAAEQRLIQRLSDPLATDDPAAGINVNETGETIATEVPTPPRPQQPWQPAQTRANNVYVGQDEAGQLTNAPDPLQQAEARLKLHQGMQTPGTELAPLLRNASRLKAIPDIDTHGNELAYRDMVEASHRAADMTTVGGAIGDLGHSAPVDLTHEQWLEARRRWQINNPTQPMPPQLKVWQLGLRRLEPDGKAVEDFAFDQTPYNPDLEKSQSMINQARDVRDRTGEGGTPEVLKGTKEHRDAAARSAEVQHLRAKYGPAAADVPDEDLIAHEAGQGQKEARDLTIAAVRKSLAKGGGTGQPVSDVEAMTLARKNPDTFAPAIAEELLPRLVDEARANATKRKLEGQLPGDSPERLKFEKAVIKAADEVELGKKASLQLAPGLPNVGDFLHYIDAATLGLTDAMTRGYDDDTHDRYVAAKEGYRRDHKLNVFIASTLGYFTPGSPSYYLGRGLSKAVGIPIRNAVAGVAAEKSLEGAWKAARLAPAADAFAKAPWLTRVGATSLSAAGEIPFFMAAQAAVEGEGQKALDAFNVAKPETRAGIAGALVLGPLVAEGPRAVRVAWRSYTVERQLAESLGKGWEQHLADLGITITDKEALARVAKLEEGLRAGKDFYQAAQDAKVSVKDMKEAVELGRSIKEAKAAKAKADAEAAPPSQRGEARGEGRRAALPAPQGSGGTDQAPGSAGEPPAAPPRPAPSDRELQTLTPYQRAWYDLANPNGNAREVFDQVRDLDPGDPKSGFEPGKELLGPRDAMRARTRHLLDQYAPKRADGTRSFNLPAGKDLAEIRDALKVLNDAHEGPVGEDAAPLVKEVARFKKIAERTAELEKYVDSGKPINTPGKPGRDYEDRALPDAGPLGEPTWRPKLSSMAAAKSRAQAIGIDPKTLGKTQQVPLAHVLDRGTPNAGQVDATKLRLKPGADSQADAVPPLVVRKMRNGGYEVLSGRESYHAAKALGLKQVPVIIADGAKPPADVPSENREQKPVPATEADLAKRKPKAPATPVEKTDPAPLRPPGPRWTNNPGAIPGEPALLLDVKDGDPDTAAAAVVEVEVEGKGVLYEARDADGNVIAREATVEEAAAAAEKAVKPKTDPALDQDLKIAGLDPAAEILKAARQLETLRERRRTGGGEEADDATIDKLAAAIQRDLAAYGEKFGEDAADALLEKIQKTESDWSLFNKDKARVTKELRESGISKLGDTRAKVIPAPGSSYPADSFTFELETMGQRATSPLRFPTMEEAADAAAKELLGPDPDELEAKRKAATLPPADSTGQEGVTSNGEESDDVQGDDQEAGGRDAQPDGDGKDVDQGQGQQGEQGVTGTEPGAGTDPGAGSHTPPSTTHGDPKKAAKLRALADAMQPQIDNKLRPAIGDQRPTPRRQRIAEQMRQEGLFLEKVQLLMRKLADLHDAKAVPASLLNVDNRAQAVRALQAHGGLHAETQQAARDLVAGVKSASAAEIELKRLTAKLVGVKIPGFFPTPPAVADQVAQMLAIEPGMSVLEPSAGLGNLVEAVLRAQPAADVVAIERYGDLRAVLKHKGFKLAGVDDFTQLDKAHKFDRIAMNPPFENGQDIEHTLKAWEHLKPGGALVSILSEGVFYRQDKKATAFREFLEEHGNPSDVYKLPAGTFKDKLTGHDTNTAARIVRISKSIKAKTAEIDLTETGDHDKPIWTWSPHQFGAMGYEARRSGALWRILDPDEALVWTVSHTEGVPVGSSNKAFELFRQHVEQLAIDKGLYKPPTALTLVWKGEGANTGRNATIVTAGDPVPAVYAIVDADELQPSHNPITFKANPLYPTNVQERDYAKDKEEQAKVNRQVTDFNPALLLTDNPDPTNGPPMVLRSGLVMGGNSRTMTIQTIYGLGKSTSHDPRAKSFRLQTIEAAERFGISTDVASGFRKPVLVRVIAEPTNDPAKMRELVRALQKGLTQEMSGAMDAASRARILMDNPDALQRLEALLGDDDSVRELLEQPIKTARIRDWLVGSGAMSRQEAARYIHNETGMFNADGKALIERILQAVVVPDVAIFDNLPFHTANKVTGNLYGLVFPKTKGGDWDYTIALNRALVAFFRWRASGAPLESWLKGQDKDGQALMAKDPIADDPRGRVLLERLAGDTSTVWRARVKAFLEFARDADPNQTEIFAGARASASDAFRAAFMLTEPTGPDGKSTIPEKKASGGGLFGGGPAAYYEQLDRLRELLSWPENMSPKLRGILGMPRRVADATGVVMMSGEAGPLGGKPVDVAKLLGDPETAEHLTRIATFHLEQHADAGDKLQGRWATGVATDLRSILRDLGYTPDGDTFTDLLEKLWQQLSDDADVKDALGDLPPFNRRQVAGGQRKSKGSGGRGSAPAGGRTGGAPAGGGQSGSGPVGGPGLPPDQVDGPGADPGVVSDDGPDDLPADADGDDGTPGWVPPGQRADYLAALNSERVVPYAPRPPQRAGHHHPRILVESKALAGVKPGELEGYEPDPRAVGDLSDPQRDQVAAVGYRIEHADAGALVSDDVGVGKSRIIGGIIADQVLRGLGGIPRAAAQILVLTKNPQNVADLTHTFHEEMKGTFRPLLEGGLTIHALDDVGGAVSNWGTTPPAGAPKPLTSEEWYDRLPAFPELPMGPGRSFWVVTLNHIRQGQRLNLDAFTKLDMAGKKIDAPLLDWVYKIGYTADTKPDANGLTWLLPPKDAWGPPAAPAGSTDKPRVVLAHTYNLTRHLAELQRWGPTLVIVDEAHLYANIAGDAQRANSLAALTSSVLYPKSGPHGHLVYMTATPASDISALQFMYGLGLWAPEDAVKNHLAGDKMGFDAWLHNATGVTKAGSWRESIATPIIEQLMRELKMDNAYHALDFWRGGFTFEMRQAKVTKVDTDAYDVLADTLLSAIRLYQEARKLVGKAPSWPRPTPANFERIANGEDIPHDEKSAPMRPDGQAIFFVKRLLVQFRMQAAIEAAKEALARGEQVVFKVLGVTETALTGDGGNLGAVFDSIPHFLPLRNKAGQIKGWRVNDGVRGTVDNLRARAAHLGKGYKILSPLKQILDEFGESNVAAIVGPTAPKDRVAQNADFQAGKRKVAVISPAGTTGINLQDLGTGKRFMVVLDLDWDSKEFKQSLGRVDRANQTTSPGAVTIYTPIAGERKFQATIAARMKALGAIAKGQTDAGATEDALNDFDMESSTWHTAINRVMQQMTLGERGMMLHGEKFDAEGEISWRDFQNDLMMLPVATGNAIYDKAEAIWKELEALDEANRGGRVARRNRGLIRETADLDESRQYPLQLHTVESVTGETYGILSGKILTRPAKNTPAKVITDAVYGKHATQLERNQFVTMQQGDRVVTGLYVPRSKLPIVKALFGYIPPAPVGPDANGPFPPGNKAGRETGPILNAVSDDLPPEVLDKMPPRAALLAQAPNLPPATLALKHKPRGKLVTRQQLTDHVIKRMRFSIGVGKHHLFRPLRALGFYQSPHTRMIRNHAANLIGTTAHEAGHAIDDILTNLTPDPAYDAELLPLGRRTSKPSYTKVMVRREGAAEFFRTYVIDPKAAYAAAPTYAAWWEKELQTKQPELWQAVREYQALVQQYIAQDPAERLEAQIDWNGGGPTFRSPLATETTVRSWYQKSIDRFAPLNWARQDLNKTKAPLPTNFSGDAYVQARLNAGNRAMVDGWVRFGVRDRDGTALAPGLLPMLHSLGIRGGRRFMELEMYLLARRANYLYDQALAGKRKLKNVVDPAGGPLGVTHDQAKATIAKYDSPAFRSAAKAVKDWNEAVFRWLQGSGFFEPGALAKIRAMNEEYVPMYRVLDHLAGDGGGGKSLVDKGPAFHMIRGSGRMIKRPIETMIRNVARIVDHVEQNRAAVLMFNEIRGKDGAGLWADRVARPIKGVTFALSEIKKSLIAAGVDPDDLKPDKVTGAPPKIDLDTLATVFRPIAHNPRDMVIALRVGGKILLWQVHVPMLYEALTGKPDAVPTNNVILRLLMMMQQAMTIGFTRTAEFATGNMQRDQGTAFLQSRYGYKPFWDFVSGLLHAVTEDSTYQLWLQSKGGASTRVGSYSDPLEHSIGKLKTSPGRRALGLLNVPLRILDVMEYLSQNFESATRISEFARGMAKEGSGVEGLSRSGLASRDVTVDFSRSGTWAREIGQWKAFFNANVQGNDYSLRHLVGRGGTAKSRIRAALNFIARGLAGITALSLILHYLGRDNPHYQERSLERENYWLIPLGNPRTTDSFLRIRKPHELGALFGTLGEKIMEDLITRHPDQVKDYVASPGAALQMVAYLIPSAIQPMVEVMANYDFYRRRPIVTPDLKDLEPELQYNRYTSETAKAIGHALGVSPVKVDHLVYGYFGTLGRDATTDVIDPLVNLLKGRKAPAVPDRGGVEQRIPGLRLFFSKDLTPGAADSVNDFYQLADRLRTVKRSMKSYTGETLARYAKENRDVLARELDIETAEDGMKLLRDQVQKVYVDPDLTAAEKRRRLQLLGDRMVNVARGALGRPPLPSRAESTN